jgi:LysM repeat protein
MILWERHAMKSWKRLLYYLLINILVSACTTVAVLVIWDRTQSPTASLTGGPAVADGTLPSTPVADQSTPATSPEAALTPSVVTVPINLDNVVPYEVESGDTLGLIADEFDVSVEELMAINQISDPNAISVGMVLYVPSTEEADPTATTTPTSTPAPQTSTTPAAPPLEARLIINAVIAPGELASEHVFITRSGDSELSLAGWQLKDEDGNVFVFPQLELYKDGGVNVWTTAGANTVIDLYWGLSAPVWSSGEKVTLLDADGKERATYTVP